jgi:hypothetical protein
MATAATIIASAFTKIGIATPTAAQNTAALATLNDLLMLQGADFMPPYITKYSHSLTIGDSEYTIGATATEGNFATTRPLKINSCFLRDSEGHDWIIKIVSAQEYSDLKRKTLEGIPSALYYSAEYPLGKVYFDSEPTVAYDAHFDMWINFTEFTTSGTTVSLPDEYRSFLIFNLAIGLAEDWNRQPSKTLYSMAEESKRIVENLNAAVRVAPKAKFDIPTPVRGSARVFSDDGIDGGAF